MQSHSSTAISSRREGQVRAAASGRAASRGLRLVGGWDGDVEGISFQSPAPVGGAGEGETEREGRRGSVEWGCSWGCLNCPVPAGRHPGTVTGPCCRPARRVSCRKGCLPWKDHGWRLLGWERQAERGSRAWASPTSIQHAPAAGGPGPSRAHTHPLSLPPTAHRFHSTHTPISPARRHLQPLWQTMPLPSARTIYTPKVKNPITYTRYQRATSNGTDREGSQPLLASRLWSIPAILAA